MSETWPEASLVLSIWFMSHIQPGLSDPLIGHQCRLLIPVRQCYCVNNSVLFTPWEHVTYSLTSLNGLRERARGLGQIPTLTFVTASRIEDSPSS